MLAPGTRIGRYEVIGPLGSGGMGEVYRARDTRLGRFVAIKTLPDSMSEERDSLVRFEREAMALAALAHPNIVALHEFDTVDGISFSVMELLEGRTVAERLAAGPVPWREAIEIAIAAAAGIGAAHDRGIVHRDIKPANIFVTHDGQVKVLDFGISRIHFQPANSTDTTQPLETNPGAVVGTLGYLAPEVLRGAPADERSDVFSLGCVLFEMLTGQRAFMRNTPMATFAAVLTDEPAPSPELGERVPQPVLAVLGRALAKDPGQRFSSMREFLSALRTLQSSTQVSGFQTVPVEETPRKTRPGVVIAILVALLSAAAWWFLRERSSAVAVPSTAPRIRSIAVLPFENTGGDPELEYLSDGLSEALINSLSRIPSLRVVARTSAFRHKGSKLDPRTLGRELEADALVVGRVVTRDGQLIVQCDLLAADTGTQLWGERYQMKLDDVMLLQERLERQISQQLRLRIGGAPVQVAHPAGTIDDEAYKLYLKGRFYWNKRTEDGYQRAIAFYRQAIERDPNFALAYSGLADCYVLSYTLKEAETMRRAKESARQALAIDESLAEPHTSLAHALHYFDWDFAGAEREFRRAIELNPNYALAHHWFGRHLVQTGRVEEGLAGIERALNLDPLSLIINADYGYLLYLGRRYDAAVTQFEKAIELDPTFVRPHVYAIWAYRAKGDLEGARRSALRAIELSGRDPETLAALSAVEISRGDRAAADKLRDELVALAAREYVAPLFMIQLFLARGELENAVTWMEKAKREEERSSLLDIAAEPLVDPYRSDPRVAATLPVFKR